MPDLPIETGAEDIQAAPRKIGHARLDLILALAAIFISSVSLFVAIENSATQRELVAADTWPFIQRNINESANPENDMTIGVSNDGVGPAKIRSMELFYRGQPVSSVKDLLRRCCGYRDDLPRIQQLPLRYGVSLIDNSVLRAGEQNAVIRIRQSASAPEIPAKFRLALRHLQFRGCYCSVLDRCWTSDLSSTKIAEIAECPAPEHPFDPLGK